MRPLPVYVLGEYHDSTSPERRVELKLTFKRGDRRRMYDESSLAVGVRHVVLHQHGGRFVAQKCADQIDVNDFGKKVAGHRAIPTEHTTGTDDAGAIDQQIDAAHGRGRRSHACDDLRLGRHVAFDEACGGTKFLGGRLTWTFLHVEQRDPATTGGQMARDAMAQAGCPTRDDSASFCYFHVAAQIISTAMAVASPPPMHNAATPRFNPRRFKACNSVATIRAPVAPTGCPNAQAPPFTLTRA